MELALSKIANLNSKLIRMWLDGNCEYVYSQLYDYLQDVPDGIDIVIRVMEAMSVCRNVEFVYIPKLIKLIYEDIISSKEVLEDRYISYSIQPVDCFSKILLLDYIDSIPILIKNKIKEFLHSSDLTFTDTIYKNCLWCIIMGKKEFPFKHKYQHFVVEMCCYILYNIYDELNRTIKELYV